MIINRFSSVLVASALGMVSTALHAQQGACDNAPWTSISCQDFNKKFNRPFSVNEQTCYTIEEKVCQITIDPTAETRSHVYAGLTFQSLSFHGGNSTWQGSLTLKKVRGSQLTLGGFRATTRFEIFEGKTDRFDTSHTPLDKVTLGNLLSMEPNDKLLFSARKYFGSQNLNRINLKSSTFQVGQASDVRLVNVDLSSSKINSDADLSRMQFERVNLNDFTITEGPGNFRGPIFIRSGNVKETFDLPRFKALTNRRMSQADLNLFNKAGVQDLTGLSFAEKDLRGLIFTASNVDGATFQGADLSGADFRGAKGILDPSHFQSALLDGAKFCQKDMPIVLRSFNEPDLVARTRAMVLEIGGAGCTGEATSSRMEFLLNLRSSLIKASDAEFNQASSALQSNSLWLRLLVDPLQSQVPVPNVLAENAKLLARMAQVESSQGPLSPIIPAADLCRAFDRFGADPARKYLRNYILDLLPVFGINRQGLSDLQSLVRKERSNPASLDRALFPNRQVSLLALSTTVAKDDVCEQRSFATSLTPSMWLRFKYLESRFHVSDNDNPSPLLGPSPAFIFASHVEDTKGLFESWFKNDSGMWLAFLKRHYHALYLLDQDGTWQNSDVWSLGSLQRNAQAVANKAEQWQQTMGPVTLRDLFALLMNVSLATELPPLDPSDGQLELSLAGDVLASLGRYASTRPLRLMALFLALEDKVVPTRALELLSLSEGLGTPFYSYFQASIRNTNSACQSVQCGDSNAVYRLALFLQHALVQDQIIHNRDISDSKLYEFLISSLESVTGVTGIEPADLGGSLYGFDIFQSLLSNPEERYQLFLPVLGADKTYLAQDGNVLLRFQYIAGDEFNPGKWTSFQRTSIRDTDCLIDSCETSFGREFPGVFQPSQDSLPNPRAAFTKADHTAFSIFYALRSALRLQFLVSPGNQSAGSANNALRLKSLAIVPADWKEKSNPWLVSLSLIHDIPIETVPPQGVGVNFASNFTPLLRAAYRETFDETLEIGLKNLEQYLVEKGGIVSPSPSEPLGLKAFDSFIKQISE